MLSNRIFSRSFLAAYQSTDHSHITILFRDINRQCRYLRTGYQSKLTRSSLDHDVDSNKERLRDFFTRSNVSDADRIRRIRIEIDAQRAQTRADERRLNAEIGRQQSSLNPQQLDQMMSAFGKRIWSRLRLVGALLSLRILIALCPHGPLRRRLMHRIADRFEQPTKMIETNDDMTMIGDKFSIDRVIEQQAADRLRRRLERRDNSRKHR